MKITTAKLKQINKNDECAVNDILSAQLGTTLEELLQGGRESE